MTVPVDMFPEWDLVPVIWKGADILGVRYSGYLEVQIDAPRLRIGGIMVRNKIMRFPISDGMVTMNLRATDDPDIDPLNFTYTVTEYIENLRGESYSFHVPSSYKETGMYLSNVIPVFPSPGTPQPQVTRDEFLVLQEQVASIEVPEVPQAQIDAAAQAVLQPHIDSQTPHPAYDEIQDLSLVFENNLI